MSKLHYPTREILISWISLLRVESRLKLALPIIDEHWYEQMLAVFERVEYSYSPENIHTKAAEIFYNTIKAHNFTDGNKRSGILAVYLFYILNGRYVKSRLDIRNLAKAVARSIGRTQHDRWIAKLTDKLERCTDSLWDAEVISEESGR